MQQTTSIRFVAGHVFRAATLLAVMAMALPTSAASGVGDATARPADRGEAAPSGTLQGVDVAAAVQALDLQRFERLVAGDIDGLAGLLADDYVHTHTSGKVDNKETYLAPLHRGATKYLAFTPSDVSVRVYGQTAVVVGRASMRAVSGGREQRVEMRFTNVWVERNGRWQMVTCQATRLP